MIKILSIQIPLTKILSPNLNAVMLSAILMRFIYVAYILTIIIINYNQTWKSKSKTKGKVARE